jgi:hypothetical protein
VGDHRLLGLSLTTGNVVQLRETVRTHRNRGVPGREHPPGSCPLKGAHRRGPGIVLHNRIPHWRVPINDGLTFNTKPTRSTSSRPDQTAGDRGPAKKTRDSKQWRWTAWA